MKQIKHTCTSNPCFLCSSCLPEWSAAINTERKTLHFRKGQIIFNEGDPVSGIYFVNSGIVKVHKHWDSEKELIIRFASDGDVFGHRGLGRQSAYPISATALSPVTACYISLTFLQTSLRVNYSLMERLLNFFADELQESEQRMRNLAHMQVKGRVAQALLAIKTKFGCSPDGTISFSLSRQDLASFAGTTYETVFRILTDLARDGIITVSGRDIRILDMASLGQLSREEPYFDSDSSMPI